MNIDHTYKPYSAQRKRRRIFGNDDWVILFEDTIIRTADGLQAGDIEMIVSALNGAFLCGQMHLASRQPV